MPGAFAEHETVAIGVERSTGGGRIVVAFGQGPHVGEAADAHRGDGRFRAARDHHVGVVVLDRLEGIADGVGGAGAGRGHGVVGSADAELDRDVAAGGVEHQLGNGEGRDTFGTLAQQPLHLSLDLLQSADARAQDHAAAEGVFGGKVQAGVIHRIDGGHQRELREAVDPLHFLVGDVVDRIPVVDVAAKLDLERRRVEQPQRMNPAFARQHALPEVVDLTTQRRDDTQTGYDHPSFHAHRPQPFRRSALFR